MKKLILLLLITNLSFSQQWSKKEIKDLISIEFPTTPEEYPGFEKLRFYSEQKENINIKLSDDSNTIVLIMRGRLSIKGIDYQEKSIVVLERENNLLNFHSSNNFKALILNGKPIEEPLVAHGPFVMNNEQEILTAIEDYQNGSMENNSL